MLPTCFPDPPTPPAHTFEAGLSQWTSRAAQWAGVFRAGLEWAWDGLALFPLCVQQVSTLNVRTLAQSGHSHLESPVLSLAPLDSPHVQ